MKPNGFECNFLFDMKNQNWPFFTFHYFDNKLNQSILREHYEIGMKNVDEIPEQS